MTPESLVRARSKCLVDKKRGKTANLLYDLAVRARLHKAVMHVAKPKQLVAKRLHAYARQIGHGPESGLQNVYFGHTHHALSNYRHGGLGFHNPGAPIDGLEFQIVETEVTKDEGVRQSEVSNLNSQIPTAPTPASPTSSDLPERGTRGRR